MQIWAADQLLVVKGRCWRKCELSSTSCKERNGPSQELGSIRDSGAPDPGVGV